MKPISDLSIDSLLYDTWLIVAELRRGVPAQQGTALYQRCLQLVVDTQTRLTESGYSAESIEHIAYAQCALLDETVLGRGRQDEGYNTWIQTPLQTHFFNTLQAGELLYERMRQVLREPAADPAVLTCFYRVLRLGFEGVYHGQLQQQPREQLMATLGEQVAAYDIALQPPLALAARPRHSSRLFQSVFFWFFIALLVLAGSWWVLHMQLQELLAALLPGGAE
ncbi:MULTISPECIES: type VI secretion system protein TssL, short form [unclassified Serratia (in: enterobacteria)]|uniref:type VI secretion system protein TssL, short form n=1 Tax=unclassified Serratia (in: enterobacteria) TaxID=2647522 RepID=UPI000506FFCB|nr:MULTISPECIES: type VI secretion system protein TssL, short form [unclassified Serratia (in: enterobacteria)]KFK94318.1 hypothetical protein IV04_22350 [Serratia sp. Ag1]KFK95868.1 hypothetical protein JV45_06540 [Serratia sp. Ag2]